MAKTVSSVTPAIAKLDLKSSIPLHRQLYDAIRQGILRGQFRPGTRLPSTRLLALTLGISRNTVMNAFSQLLSEGCIEGKVGSGTYVTCDLLNCLPASGLAHFRSQRQLSGKQRKLSRRGALIARSLPCCPKLVDVVGVIPFRPGVPAFDEFPFQIWERLFHRHWRHPPREILCQRETSDFRPLQEAIAEYLRTARGVRCEPEQVIMFRGTQQALDLAARILLDDGDAAWIEDPGYIGARNALMAAGCRLTPVPVDREGLDVDVGISRNSRARLVYVSPSHQYPLAVTMSLGRRIKLLDWARRANAWILEDDYDSEFRYVGWPLAALQGFDSDNRIIYLGSFSKLLLPAIRLSYIIAPPDLVDKFIASRRLVGSQATIEQVVLADFIIEGHFVRHIHRMRNLYARRQTALITVVQRKLEGLLDVRGAEGGMSLVGWLPEGIDDQVASSLAAAHGVETPALSDCYLSRYRRGGLILGYGAFDERIINDGVDRLRLALLEAERDVRSRIIKDAPKVVQGDRSRVCERRKS